MLVNKRAILGSIKIFFYNFFNKRIDILSNSLTYTTAFAFFPALALLVGFSKGFALDNVIIKKLIGFLPNNNDLVVLIQNTIQNFIDSAQNGVVAGFGIVILIWSVIRVMLSLEIIFNDIWQIEKPRNLHTMFINYLATLLLIPILIILIVGSSSIVTKFIASLFSSATITYYIVRTIQIILAIFLQAAIFNILPNTKIKFRYSLYGSTFSMILIVLLITFYTRLQFLINSYSFVYGSIAYIPILLLIIKFIWVIILMGAEINYLLSINKDFNNAINNVPYGILIYTTVYIYYIITKNFNTENELLDIEKIHEITGIEQDIIRSSLNSLIKNGYIIELETDPTETYQVLYNPNKVTVEDILDKVMLENFVYKNIFSTNKDTLNYINFIQKIKYRNDTLIGEI